MLTLQAPVEQGVTEELDHAILLRLASEFQGFCRDLHSEAVRCVIRAAVAEDTRIRQVLTAPFVAARRLDRGNAEPGGLGHDFGLLGIPLWATLKARYPQGEQWVRQLALLNEARNGIAHDDADKIAKVHAEGWPVTPDSLRRWRVELDGLAEAMDHVVGEYLIGLLKVTPW